VSFAGLNDLIRFFCLIANFRFEVHLIVEQYPFKVLADEIESRVLTISTSVAQAVHGTSKILFCSQLLILLLAFMQ